MPRQGSRTAAAALSTALLLAGGAYAPSASTATSAGAAGAPAEASVPAGAGRHAPAATPKPTQITLPLKLRGPRTKIAMAPVGLSLEYPLMTQDLGSGPCPPPALVAELQRLGSPPLALAGESQDLTAPPGVIPTLTPSWENATLYPLPSPFWTQLHCLLTNTNELLDAGLNLRKGVPAWAAQIVAGAQSAATNGLEFSLGNEPDLYSLHNYASLTAALPNAESVAVNLYLQLATALEQTVPGLPIVGPELARAARWRHALPRVISTLHERTVGVHLYPLSACEGPSSVTIEHLLSPAAADAPTSLQWVVADADAADVPAIIGEANSASCGGQAGVSDSPAAAVWAVRFVLSALQTGFREVRFHLSGGAYDPFVVRGSTVYDRPLDSALAALNRWLPLGASIQTVAHPHGLFVTAIGGSAGTPQLILDNESAKPQTVVLEGVQTVQTQLLSAAHAGLHVAQVSAAGGRVKLALQANDVLAVLPLVAA
jgi:hypothetical protein